MRYFINCLIMVFFLGSLVLDAQTNVTIRRKDFKTKKQGFNEACEHVAKGDTYFAEKGVWYSDAYNEYLQALVYNNANAGLNYKTGVSALFSDKKEEAAGFFLKAYELKKDVAEDVLLLAGCSLQFAGRYSEAVEKFTAYLGAPGKKPKKNVLSARQHIQECNSAMIITKDTLNISIENLGPNINSDADDYSEILTLDGKTMYFASRRELTKTSQRRPDTKFDENIFISRLNNGSWEAATTAGKDLATKYSESPLYVNAENNMLYVYSGNSNNGDIKVSVNKKGVWKTHL